MIIETGLGEPDLRHPIRNIDAGLALVVNKNLNYAPGLLFHKALSFQTPFPRGVMAASVKPAEPPAEVPPTC